jgi:hypothetical protein
MRRFGSGSKKQKNKMKKLLLFFLVGLLVLSCTTSPKVELVQGFLGSEEYQAFKDSIISELNTRHEIGNRSNGRFIYLDSTYAFSRTDELTEICKKYGILPNEYWGYEYNKEYKMVREDYFAFVLPLIEEYGKKVDTMEKQWKSTETIFDTRIESEMNTMVSIIKDMDAEKIGKFEGQKQIDEKVNNIWKIYAERRTWIEYGYSKWFINSSAYQEMLLVDHARRSYTQLFVEDKIKNIR